MSQDSRQPWSREELEQRLRAKEAYYHIHHPYHRRMYAGELTQAQMQGWVANRFYYQVSIPQKDAALMANCPDRDLRRRWIQRIEDHDGTTEGGGGIERWLGLGEAVGLSREELWSMEHVLPGVRFAVDKYLEFVRRASWREGVASSLTELFAPAIHQERLDSWPTQYPWIDAKGLEYFRKRPEQAHRDVQDALSVTLDYFRTREEQERALEILQLKLDILWTMLDAMYLAYVVGMPPYDAVDANTGEGGA